MDCEFFLGEETEAKLNANFVVRPLDIVGIKGKKIKTKIDELMRVLSRDPQAQVSLEQMEPKTLFAEAYNAFEKGDLNAAKTQFEAIHAKFPEDEPTKIYLERLRY